jgi:hypothetical protein
MWTLLPFLGTCEIEQLPAIDVSCTDDARVLATSACFACIGATARACGGVCPDIRGRDEGGARRIGTVSRVRSGEFENQVLIRRDEVVGQEASCRINGDLISTALEGLFGFQSELECLWGRRQQ